MDKKEFSEWALVELFGHQKIAGKVSNFELGGSSFVRVDVPEADGQPGFTKLYGAGAIYAITLTDELTALAAVTAWRPEPFGHYTIQSMLESRQLPAANEERDYFDPEVDEGPF